MIDVESGNEVKHNATAGAGQADPGGSDMRAASVRGFGVRGTGPMIDLVRAFDWSSTPLGSIESWSVAMLTVVNLVLSSSAPCALYWGSEMLNIYNDAYCQVLRDRHPAALGRPLYEVWADLWPVIGPEFEAVLASGAIIQHEEVLLSIMEDGKVEERYFNYAASPIFEEDRIVAIFNPAQDVTEAVHDRNKLAAVRDQLNQMLEATTDGVLSVDRRWRITYLNERARTSIAQDGDITGQDLWEAFPRLVYEGSPFVEHYPRAMYEQIPADFDAYYPQPLDIWIEIHVRPTHEGIVIFFRDVTLQKQEAAARLTTITRLRAELERFRQLNDHSPLGVYQADLQGNVHYANARTQQIFGLSEEEIIGSGWLSRVHPDDVQGLIDGWKKANEKGEYFEHIYRVAQPGQAVKYILGRSAILADGEGRATGTVGMVEDITERKLAQLALQESQARLNAMFATSLEHIGLLTPEGVILDTNSASLASVDVTREQVVGQNFWETPWFQSTPGAPERIRQELALVAAGATVRRELSLMRPDGTVAIFDFSLTPVFDHGSEVLFIVPEGRDITILKQVEAVLLQNEKLAAESRPAAPVPERNPRK